MLKKITMSKIGKKNQIETSHKQTNPPSQRKLTRPRWLVRAVCPLRGGQDVRVVIGGQLPLGRKHKKIEGSRWHVSIGGQLHGGQDGTFWAVKKGWLLGGPTSPGGGKGYFCQQHCKLMSTDRATGRLQSEAGGSQAGPRRHTGLVGILRLNAPTHQK